jgi:nonsense-mediated mRNA decay protein 3
MEAPHSHAHNNVASILCCICGVRVDQNPSNMCANCLKSQVTTKAHAPHILCHTLPHTLPHTLLPARLDSTPVSSCPEDHIVLTFSRPCVQVDITEGISKQVTIFFCRGCGRYQKPPWIVADLESREMMVSVRVCVCASVKKSVGFGW